MQAFLLGLGVGDRAQRRRAKRAEPRTPRAPGLADRAERDKAEAEEARAAGRLSRFCRSLEDRRQFGEGAGTPTRRAARASAVGLIDAAVEASPVA